MDSVFAYGKCACFWYIMTTFNRSASASRTFLPLINKYRSLQVQVEPQILQVRQGRNGLQRERISDFQSEESPAPGPSAVVNLI